MKTKDTVLLALRMAVNNRKPKNEMIFHSDRGIQYACRDTVNYLKSYKFTQSMSRKGNCWDNAVAESFFKSLKTELIYGNKLLDKKQMKILLFEYIEIWYNKKRRHSYLNYQTIEEFIRKYIEIHGNQIYSNYFSAVSDYISFFHIEQLPIKEVELIMSNIYGDALTKEVILDMATPQNIFSYYNLPNCFNCENCQVKTTCHFFDLIKMEKQLNLLAVENKISFKQKFDF